MAKYNYIEDILPPGVEWRALLPLACPMTPIALQTAFYRVREWRWHGNVSMFNVGTHSLSTEIDTRFAAGCMDGDPLLTPLKDERDLYLKAGWSTSISQSDNDAITTNQDEAIYPDLGPSIRFMHNFLWIDQRSQAIRVAGDPPNPDPWRYEEFIVGCAIRMDMNFTLLDPDTGILTPSFEPLARAIGTAKWQSGEPGKDFYADITFEPDLTSGDSSLASVTSTLRLEPYRYWRWDDDYGNNPTFDEQTGMAVAA